jgi:hypothetical protein
LIRNSEKAFKAFERKVHRLYELLEQSGAEVTWDDHIPDPDNPTQLRQIDITIRRDGKLTLVECRHHTARQNVQWIESLIGRRTSLRAHTVIAVSSSGFTKGALMKAKKRRIIVRDLQRLTESEIKSWGQRIALTLSFYQFSDLDLCLFFDRASIPNLDPAILKAELGVHPAVQSLFTAASLQVDRFNLVADGGPRRIVTFDLRLERDDFRLCGEPVLGVAFRGKARLLDMEVAPPVISGYGAPKKNSTQREVIIEDFVTLGKTSIAHEGDRISIFLDVSQVQTPPFCLFHSFCTNGEQEMEHDSLELYGLDKKLRVEGKGMTASICAKC